MKPFLALLAAALVGSLAFAGCTQGPADDVTQEPPSRAPFHPSMLSQPVHGIRAAESLAVPSSVDGKLLENAVYRPDTDEPVPVFINFSPYWGDAAMHGGDPFARYMVNEYVPRGYAVVLSSVRGTGHSEGCFQIGGDLELQDAHDVIDFFAKQPWSNGNVAAGGKSYDSTTQNGVVAKVPHPALKGIFHVSGITDMYRYNAKDGVPYSFGPIFNTYYFQQGIHEYGLGNDPLGLVGGSPSGASSPMDEDAGSLARLIDDAACVELPAMQASGVGSGTHGMRDAYWEERNWNRYLPESPWNGSIFFVHGLQDWNVKPDHIDPWLSIVQAKGIDVLGWLHQDSHGGSGGHVYPMRTDWNVTMLRWLDHALKGKDTHMDKLWGFESQGSDGVWRRSVAWPPAPVGQLLVGDDGPLVEGPETATLRIAGTPYAEVEVVPAHEDDIVRIVLYDGDRFLTEAVRRLALSDDLSTPRPVIPGVAMRVNVTFFPVDHVLEDVQQLRGLLGSDEIPATPPGFLVRPGQGTQVAYNHVGLHLPIADAAPMAVQPEGMACFTC